MFTRRIWLSYNITFIPETSNVHGYVYDIELAQTNNSLNS